MSKKSKFKRVVVISDLHCGHRVGLTPPGKESQISGTSHQRISKKYYKAQLALWKAYAGMIKRLGKIDILIVNGDAIDGRGEKSGGTELIAVDRNVQVEMAAECINFVGADTVLMTRGTGYHVGNTESFEDNIADKVGAKKIEDHAWYDINGVVFDVKHFIGSSGIPHGRSTAVKRDQLWSLIWHERNEQPRGEPGKIIVIRSHVHYFDYSGNSDYLAITTPALQGMGSKFGAKICSGTVDFGLIYFDIKNNGDWSWGWDTVRVAEQQATALKL
jgi:hypothetical protein